MCHTATESSFFENFVKQQPHLPASCCSWPCPCSFWLLELTAGVGSEKGFPSGIRERPGYRGAARARRELKSEMAAFVEPN